MIIKRKNDFKPCVTCKTVCLVLTHRMCAKVCGVQCTDVRTDVRRKLLCSVRGHNSRAPSKRANIEAKSRTNVSKIRPHFFKLFLFVIINNSP